MEYIGPLAGTTLRLDGLDGQRNELAGNSVPGWFGRVARDRGSSLLKKAM